MKYLRRLLLPFTWLYALIMHTRNFLFDVGWLSSTSYNVPVISVGNITVGGTGKTPLTEHILRLLLPNQRCAMLSRGYGRKTRGVLLADKNSDHCSIGDEPMQMFQKFNELMVVVAEKRREGMELLLNQQPKPQVVVLDDAYQHRYVKPGFSVLVMDYHRPMWNDFCFPAGNLREPLSGIKRADVVVVNKAPVDLSVHEANLIRGKLNLKAGQELFFTSVSYKEPMPLVENEHLKKPFSELVDELSLPLLVLAGIGNPKPFFKMAEKFGVPVSTLQYADHHDFTEQDIRKIETYEQQEKMPAPLILTTEKDAVRLASLNLATDELKERIWYIPIELEFLFEAQSLFDKKIRDYVGKN